MAGAGWCRVRGSSAAAPVRRAAWPGGWLLLAALLALLLVAVRPAQAGTYANAATTFSWIDPSTHARLGATTTPYAFRNTGGCGTTPPILDDTLSDQIPLGFLFTFGDKTFDSVRVMSNGRIQLTSSTIPLDNTTCGYGSPVTQLPLPDSGLTYTMRAYGNDLDPTPKSASYSSPCADGSTANNNPCYVSYATVGSAPNRQFVVSWVGVPEWSYGGTPVGAYNFQIIVQESGSFIYQYGTDVQGPQASTAQIGWEVSTSNYDTVAAGFPVANTAIRFFVPHPVVEYLMEQTSWAGSGSVTDTSGNGANGTPVGTPQPTITGAGKVCNGALFSGGSGQAINSGLAVPSAMGNSGTIAFWYKSANAWTQNATADEVLFDASLSSGQWFYLIRRGGNSANSAKLRFVLTDSLGNVQLAETAQQSVAANTWVHVAVTWSFNNVAGGNNDRFTIYVNGVQQAQSTASSTTLTLSPSIGSLYIGGSRAGLSYPTTGTASSVTGVIDEFRAYNYEASQSTIQAEMNLNTGGCLNHYAVYNAATGLSCQLTQVTVAAHTASHGAYINYASVTLSTSDGLGDWTLLSGFGVLTPGATNTGRAVYAFNGESQVVLGLTHPTTGTVVIGATDGTYGTLESTPLVVSACAVGKFNACEPTAAGCPTAGSTTYANLYTKLAGTAFTLNLVAVQGSGSLDTTFSKPVNVYLLANTSAPSISGTSNCPTAQTATISLGAVTFAAGRASVSVGTTAFSAVSPNYSAYRDVRVEFVCSAANCGSAVTSCATDGFAVRPVSFSSVSSSASNDATGTSATTTTALVKAGSAFTLTAGTGTPGYGGTPAVDATKTEWLGVPSGGRSSPGTGTVAGNFTTAAAVASGNGATGSAFTYDEVGYFRFKAGGIYDANFAAVSGDVSNGDCLNTPPNDFNNTPDATGRYGCKIGNAAATAYFGRFVPDHFDLGTVSSSWGCGTTFSYMGQPFSLTTTVLALNSGGVTTQNYTGVFARGTVAMQAVNANNGTALGSRVGFTAPWSGGSAALAATSFSRLAAPDGSYESLAIGVAVTDADATTSLVSRNMDQANPGCTADSTGQSNGTCSAVKLATTALRFGRLRLAPAQCSPYVTCRAQAVAEYWKGSAWVTNTADNCTTLASANLSLHGPTSGAATLTAAPGTFNAGTGTVVLTPSPGKSGLATLCAYANSGSAKFATTAPTCTTPASSAGLGHLAGAWGDTTYTWDPAAQISFGAPRAPGGFLYRRENF